MFLSCLISLKYVVIGFQVFVSVQYHTISCSYQFLRSRDNQTFFNPNQAGEGGNYAPLIFKRLFLWNRTSDWPQTRLWIRVYLLSRCLKRNLPIRTIKAPWRVFSVEGSLHIFPFLWPDPNENNYGNQRSTHWVQDPPWSFDGPYHGPTIHKTWPFIYWQ